MLPVCVSNDVMKCNVSSNQLKDAVLQLSSDIKVESNLYISRFLQTCVGVKVLISVTNTVLELLLSTVAEQEGKWLVVDPSVHIFKGHQYTLQ